MRNVMDRDLKLPDVGGKSPIHSSDLIPSTIQQRHLESNLYAIKFGLAADRPVTPGEDSHYFAYFSTDTFVLSCWTGVTWKTTTLA